MLIRAVRCPAVRLLCTTGGPGIWTAPPHPKNLDREPAPGPSESSVVPLCVHSSDLRHVGSDQELPRQIEELFEEQNRGDKARFCSRASEADTRQARWKRFLGETGFASYEDLRPGCPGPRRSLQLRLSLPT